MGAYWKPSAAYLLSVVGYRVPVSIVLEVAGRVVFQPPGVVTLPVSPGRVISRSAAISAARQASGSQRSDASAKLSSWTEISALLSYSVRAAGPAPGELRGSPWRPVWAVLLSGQANAAGRASAAGQASAARSLLVVVDAATGHPVLTRSVHRTWFAVLTDRAATTRQCPGGSTTRLPFGVLTRDEEKYVTGGPGGPTAPGTPGPGKPTYTIRLVLSTIPAVNRADPGLYGGCVQVNCSLHQLVWVTITRVRAAPGHTVPCLPPGASYPAGYHPKKVSRYFSVAVPDNYGIGCGKLPERLRRLKDLAPASPA